MRNVFNLAKREQRIVISIVVALVAFAFAKHWWDRESQMPPTTATSTPTPAPTRHAEEEQPDSNDSR
jgi:hypothetical protein